MTILVAGRVNGIPGPKGSLNAFCTTCSARKAPQRVVLKEQSEVGVRFRALVVESVKKWIRIRGLEPYTGAIEVCATFYITRPRQIRNGELTGEWTPSGAKPYPTFRNSGDVEKHVRTVHDAFMEAGLIKDDSQVVGVVARKRWATAANPRGVSLMVRAMSEVEEP